MLLRLAQFSILPLLLISSASAQTNPEGYLCCNMRSDGSWISDINYAENGKRIIPLGTPVKVTGYGRYRVHIEVLGGRQSLGNDYSRDLDLNAFAARYVTRDDPNERMSSYPEKIRTAIKTSRLVPGMTREQVFMSVGYPVSSENPYLDAKVLRFWLGSFAEFQVVLDDNGLVKEITSDPQTRNRVSLDQ